MNGTMWTTLVALSAIGLAGGPSARPPRVAGMPVSVVAGGPPDTLLVNSRASSIHWKGTGLGGRAMREGTISIGKGMFVIRHEQLTSGIFTVDMTQLDAPLRGEDFFDAGHHPTAWFNSTGVKRVGQARWQISGNLTMRGVTRPITFDTDVRWEELGHMIAASSFTIDRRQWGIGTDAGLAGAVADNELSISVSLDARRKQAAVATR